MKRDKNNACALRIKVFDTYKDAASLKITDQRGQKTKHVPDIDKDAIDLPNSSAYFISNSTLSFTDR